MPMQTRVSQITESLRRLCCGIEDGPRQIMNRNNVSLISKFGLIKQEGTP